MIQAVTFDFWDTIVIDDSDEAERAKRGLATKAAAREALFVDEILAHHPEIGRERAREGFNAANAFFNHEWKVKHRTPCTYVRLSAGLIFLEIEETPGFATMVEAYEAMEVELPPILVPGIRECLEALKGKVKIGIISDAIVTPGTGLRQILAHYELLHYFDHCVFSDEVDAAKPDRIVFDEAAEGLGVPVKSIVHVGDREANDIAGPNGVGAMSILYTGAIDRGSKGTAASAVCSDYADFIAILAKLERQ